MQWGIATEGNALRILPVRLPARHTAHMLSSQSDMLIPCLTQQAPLSRPAKAHSISGLLQSPDTFEGVQCDFACVPVHGNPHGCLWLKQYC